MAALSCVRATCLERATILQACLAGVDRQADVVIGVTSSSAGFAAHAWIEEGSRPHEATGYREVYRIPSSRPVVRG
jgi:hypothetical protein